MKDFALLDPCGDRIVKNIGCQGEIFIGIKDKIQGIIKMR